MKYLLLFFLLLTENLPALADLSTYSPPKQIRIRVTRGSGRRGEPMARPNIQIYAPDDEVTAIFSNVPKFLIQSEGIANYRVTVTQPLVSDPLYDRTFENPPGYNFLAIDTGSFQKGIVYSLIVTIPGKPSYYARSSFNLTQVDSSIRLHLSQLHSAKDRFIYLYSQGYYIDAVSILFNEDRALLMSLLKSNG